MKNFENKLKKYGLEKMSDSQMKKELLEFIRDQRMDLEEVMDKYPDSEDEYYYNLFLHVENWLSE